VVGLEGLHGGKGRRTGGLLLILRRGRSARGVVLGGTLRVAVFAEKGVFNCCGIEGVYFGAWSRDVQGWIQ
jgi:hypothetical protein